MFRSCLCSPLPASGITSVPPLESPIPQNPRAGEPPPPPIFYSQCAEDKFLYEHYFKYVKNGVYIELGALDGLQITNTKFLKIT
jgi:hypothetical protein